jgi:uncharacterized protein involved in outer membrane biogenesis
MRKHTSLKIFAGFIGLILVSLVIAVAWVSTHLDEYKGVATAMVQRATGRRLLIEGEVQMAPSLVPTIEAEGVRFANAEWASAPDMVKVKSLRVRFALIPLLSGQIAVGRLILIEPAVYLETDADGRGNWEFASGKHVPADETGTAVAGKGEPALSIEELEIENGHLSYHAGDTGETTSLGIHRLMAQAEEPSGPVELEMTGQYERYPFEVTALVGALRTLLADEPWPLQATLESNGVRLALKGSLQHPLQGKGVALDVDLDADSAGDLPGLAEAGLRREKPVQLSGRFSDTEGGLRLGGMKASVGRTDLAGTVSFALTGTRPGVVAELTSKQIDAEDLVAEAGAPGSTQKAERVIPADPVPVEALRAVDAEVSLRAGQVAAGGVVLQDVAVKFVLDAGRLSIRPAAARLAGGQINASVDLDARGRTAGLGATLDGRRIDRGTLLRQLMGRDVMSGGSTDVTVRLQGKGNTVRAVAAGLNGEVLVVTGEGRINNRAIDLAGGNVVLQLLGMLNPFTKQESHTTLKCATFHYDISDGIATTKNGIALETDKVQILGSGTINLKNERLELLIESRPNEGIVKDTVKTLIPGTGVSLANLVKVGGTLADPKLRLNPTGVAKEGVSVTAAVATGGLSMIAESLFKEVTKDASPCLTAQGKAAPSGSKGEVRQAGAAQDGSSEKKEKRGVGGFIKGIIGK